ncbi:MAG: MoxR family ATPase [Magnetococcales bacterium]|nr:MoxR family ATPase [Magnetococcales bacterium]
MFHLFYPRPNPSSQADPLPTAEDDDTRKAPYFPDDDLKSAVNVALLLGRPLLVTGEPGVGKTRLAYHIAQELTPGSEPLRFDVKSITKASDLFYQYDHLAAFRDNHTGKKEDHSHYLHFNALGTAILLACSKEIANQWWNKKINGEWDGPRRSVVLIDEIDKAPRDVPNDMLNEIDNFSFKIAEAEFSEIEADSKYRPITILTSNSEKPLPEPFLRRCVYHHIAFPTSEKLANIIQSRFPEYNPNLKWMTQAIQLFLKLREPASGLRKIPGTAELLEWLRVLQHVQWENDGHLQSQETLVKHSMGAIVKTREDQALVSELLEQWIKELHT